MTKYFPVSGELHGLHRSTNSAVVGNCSIASVAFHNNSIGIPSKPKDRCVIRDVSVYRCEHWACHAYGALFEDVTVTDIRGGGKAPSFLWGCVYSRVTLRGLISGLLFRWQLDPNDVTTSKRFLASNLALYESIDWALDISAAKFSFLQCLTGVPPKLVRINPEVHFVLSLKAASELVSRSAAKDIWAICAEELIESGMDSVVIVVGGSGKKQQAEIQSALALRAEGLLQ